MPSIFTKKQNRLPKIISGKKMSFIGPKEISTVCVAMHRIMLGSSPQYEGIDDCKKQYEFIGPSLLLILQLLLL